MYVRVYSFVLCIKGLYTKLYKVDTASQCNRNKACFIVRLTDGELSDNIVSYDDYFLFPVLHDYAEK